MFTGLVQDVGGVVDVLPRGTSSLRLVLATRLSPSRLDLGASVACNGVCLTVVERHDVPATGESLVAFDVGPETLRVSQLGGLAKGHKVNLEPALRVGDALGGHDVSGHVDASLRVRTSAEWSEGFWRLEIEVPSEYKRLVVPKGSFAVRGVSLTIADVSPMSPDVDSGLICGIMLVPHTLEQTNLSQCVSGAFVEVEFDKNVKTIATLLELMVPTLLPQNPTR
ncbi:MAG: riboflavin synthase [Silvanigrellales bacterium]|nr:riboflavin synthase [Silvanigrellales bacterium]